MNQKDIYKLERLKRIEEKKKVIKSKKERDMQKYTSNFNEIFTFFLKSYRAGILTFCGSIIDSINFDINEDDAKFCFRKFEAGHYNYNEIYTKHPNVLRAVIIGKKAWGLWVGEWVDGIVEWSFTKEEILEQFISKGINIPESFNKEFDNLFEKRKIKRYETK